MTYFVYAAEKQNNQGNLIAYTQSQSIAIQKAKQELKQYKGEGWVKVVNSNDQTIFAK